MGRPEPARRYDTVDDVLAHYGVKGMRWGVRKSDDSGGSGGGKKPEPSADFENVKSHKKTIKSGGTKALSNKELQEVVNRMNLEQQYVTLKKKETTPLKQKLDRGTDYLKKGTTLYKAGTTLYNLAQSPAGTAVRRAVIGV
jgi:hypothetical protein